MKTMQYIYEWLTDGYRFLGGVLMNILGILLPVKDMVLFITVLFIIDVLFGYWKDKKFNKAHFKTRKVWDTTMPRWLFSVVILILLFYWDNVHHQDYIKTYFVGGYFLSGTVIVSIIRNGFTITGWIVFKNLEDIVVKQIENNTGEKIQEDEEDK